MFFNHLLQELHSFDGAPHFARYHEAVLELLQHHGNGKLRLLEALLKLFRKLDIRAFEVSVESLLFHDSVSNLLSDNNSCVSCQLFDLLKSFFQYVPRNFRTESQVVSFIRSERCQEIFILRHAFRIHDPRFKIIYYEVVDTFLRLLPHEAIFHKHAGEHLLKKLEGFLVFKKCLSLRHYTEFVRVAVIVGTNLSS